MSNRSEGNRFEQEFCSMMSAKGWWVHNMAQNKAGQPADIIAVRDSFAHLIDAKVCEKDVFFLSRVEANQETAMIKWRECGNGETYFALKIGSTGEVYMMSFSQYKVFLKKGIKKLNKVMIESLLSFEDWSKLWI